MWSAELTAAAERGLEASLSYGQIASDLNERFGTSLSREAVRQKLLDVRPDDLRARAEERRAARAARDARLRRAADFGLAAFQIAEQCGGVASADLVRKIVPQEDRVSFNRCVAQLRRSKHWGLFGPPWARNSDNMLPPDPIVSSGKSLVELAERECRWSIGRSRDGAHRFCAEPTADGECYCEHHHV